MDLSDSKKIVDCTDPIQMPVSELLTGTYHFTIPSYQRGYRWESGDGIIPNEETKQVDDLLNDLTRFVTNIDSGNANYYLQPLMVKPRQNGQDFEWEVLDGQQRLTTMLLMLKCLNEKLMEKTPLNLFTIKYDNRPQLDFGRISYNKSNQINYDYPKPNSNQDSYYVRKAKDRIEKWYDDEISVNTQLQDRLKEALLYPDKTRKDVKSAPSLRAIFIWYNVEPIISNGGTATNRLHDIEVFNRLNRGKIGLTDSELIKALFILCLKKHGTPPGSSLTIETLVRKWDDMERKLQDESLWKMISPIKKEYQNRLDLLFDFIRESDINSKEKRSYLYYYKKMSLLPDVSDLELLWNDIKRHFDKLCKWHEDAHCHNFVGYLVECGRSVSEINRRIVGKSSVVVLGEMVRETLTTKGVVFDVLGEPNLEDLNYKEHSDAIRKVLLLFNVVTCDKYGQKFPFDSFRDYSYDIEHVNSQTDNPIEKIEEKKEWIKEQAFPCLMEDRLEMDKTTNRWIQSAASARELILQGIALLKDFKKYGNKDVGDKFKFYRKRVESFYAFGTPDASDADISANRDAIGNLTLLNSTINREYKNALYPNKLKTLKRCDQEGVYIPLCTKYLFLKYYTNTSNTASAFNMMRWRKEDQDDYLKAIRITLKSALL